MARCARHLTPRYFLVVCGGPAAAISWNDYSTYPRHAHASTARRRVASLARSAVTRPTGRPRLGGIGALAGASSALVFTAVHHLLISPIWFALPAMLVAGAVCGACLGGTYSLVASTPSVHGWVRFNVFFLAMFVALGVTSVAAFDPVTSVAVLLRTNEPPRELIAQALPVTAIFAVASAVLMGALYRPRPAGVLALLGTVAVLLLLLGLNISVLGLVEVSGGEARLLGETFGLLAALALVYVAVVIVLARRTWSRGESA